MHKRFLMSILLTSIFITSQVQVVIACLCSAPPYNNGGGVFAAYESYNASTQTYSNQRPYPFGGSTETVYEGDTVYYVTNPACFNSITGWVISPGTGGSVSSVIITGTPPSNLRQGVRVIWGAAGTGTILVNGLCSTGQTVTINSCPGGNVLAASSGYSGGTMTGILPFPAPVNAGDLVYYKLSKDYYGATYNVQVTGGILNNLYTDGSGYKIAEILWGHAGTGEIRISASGLCPSPVSITITTPEVIFDGSDDRISIPHHSDYNLAAGNFTIEAWIKASAVQNSTEATIFSKRSITTDGIWFGLDAGGELAASFTNYQFQWSDEIDLRDDTWHHVAITRTSRNIAFYVDGEQVGAGRAGTGSTSNISTTADAWIGNDNAAGSSAFTGSMKGVRIWSVSRTDIELLDTWKTNLNKFTVNLIGFWDMNDLTQTQTDRSNTGNNGYLGSNSGASDAQDPTITPASPGPFTINALQFDANDDCVEIAHDATHHNFGTGDFTIEAYVSSKNWLNEQTIYSKRTSGSDGVWFGLDGSGVPVLKLNGTTYVSSIPDLRDAGWKHIAVTRSGSTISFYDESSNSPSGTGTYSGSTVTTANGIKIGNDVLASKGFNGSIDEVRIWNTALTGTVINGQKTATSLGGLTQTGNLKGWWRFNAAIGQIDKDFSNINKTAYLGASDNTIESSDPLRIADQAFAGARKGLLFSSANHTSSLNVEAYPNPFTETINLTAYGLSSGQAKIIVADVTGTELYTSMITENTPVLLGELLPAGMYLVTITDDTSVRTVKIVKK